MTSKEASSKTKEEELLDIAVKLSVTASIEGSKASFPLSAFIRRYAYVSFCNLLFINIDIFRLDWVGEYLPMLAHKFKFTNVLEYLKSFPDYIKVVEEPGKEPIIFPVIKDETKIQMDLIDETYESDFYKDKELRRYDLEFLSHVSDFLAVGSL